MDKKEDLLKEFQEKVEEMSIKYSYTMARRANMSEEDFNQVEKLLNKTNFVNGINAESSENQILEALNQLKVIVNQLKVIFARYE